MKRTSTPHNSFDNFNRDLNFVFMIQSILNYFCIRVRYIVFYKNNLIDNFTLLMIKLATVFCILLTYSKFSKIKNAINVFKKVK